MSSPDNSSIPPLTEIVDNYGQTWTIALDGSILINGVSAADGHGSEILWLDLKIYVHGTDNNWYLWENSNWSNVGPQRPGPPNINLEPFVINYADLKTFLDLYKSRIKFMMFFPNYCAGDGIGSNYTIGPNQFLLIVDVA